MKKSRFTDSQILAILKQAEAGKAVRRIAVVGCISEASCTALWSSLSKACDGA